MLYASFAVDPIVHYLSSLLHAAAVCADQEDPMTWRPCFTGRKVVGRTLSLGALEAAEEEPHRVPLLEAIVARRPRRGWSLWSPPPGSRTNSFSLGIALRCHSSSHLSVGLATGVGRPGVLSITPGRTGTIAEGKKWTTIIRCRTGLKSWPSLFVIVFFVFVLLLINRKRFLCSSFFLCRSGLV